MTSHYVYAVVGLLAAHQGNAEPRLLWTAVWWALAAPLLWSGLIVGTWELLR